jgi:hypothetical protein
MCSPLLDAIAPRSINTELRERKYVALKIFTRSEGETCRDEFRTYKAIEEANRLHRGHPYLRTALDMFTIELPEGRPHYCLVQKPLWDTWADLLHRVPTRRYSQALLKDSLRQLLQALDCLHRNCKLVHTGKRADITDISPSAQRAPDRF